MDKRISSRLACIAWDIVASCSSILSPRSKSYQASKLSPLHPHHPALCPPCSHPHSAPPANLSYFFSSFFPPSGSLFASNPYCPFSFSTNATYFACASLGVTLSSTTFFQALYLYFACLSGRYLVSQRRERAGRGVHWRKRWGRKWEGRGGTYFEAPGTWFLGLFEGGVLGSLFEEGV